MGTHTLAHYPTPLHQTQTRGKSLRTVIVYILVKVLEYEVLSSSLSSDPIAKKAKDKSSLAFY